MRKRYIYLATGLGFGALGFFVADSGQFLGAVVGFGLGILIVFLAQAFPRFEGMDERDPLDKLDSLDKT